MTDDGDGPSRDAVRTKRLYAWVVAVCAGVGGFLAATAGHRLDRPLATWDEAIYYDAATNVLDGRWLLPLHGNAQHPLGVIDPFLHKPPLAYWLYAGGLAAFGETPASARVVAAVATGALVLVTVLLAIRFGGVLAGVAAAVVAWTMPALYGLRAGDSIATDQFLVLFSMIAVYLFLRATDADTPRTELRYSAAAGAVGGLAVLAKGPAAGPVALACLPLAVWCRDDLSRRSWGVLVGSALAVAAPWFVAVGLVAPGPLVEQMLLRQTVGRAAGEFVSTPGSLPFMDFPYFRYLPAYFGVWWGVVPGSALVLAYVGRDDDPLVRLQLLVWGVVLGVGGIYLVFGNHGWYWQPLAPALTVAISVAVTRLPHIVEELAGAIRTLDR